MSHPVRKLYENLYAQVGHYRQLVETLRLEHAALVDANYRGVQEAVAQKESLIVAIQRAEGERLNVTAELAVDWNVAYESLSLTQIIHLQQAPERGDPKLADQLQSVLNTLRVLVKKVAQQNQDNSALVQASMQHIEVMKRNVLGEPIQKSETYTPQGMKKPGQPTSRFLTQEG